MLKNSQTAYGGFAKLLHWLMALIIGLMLVIGYFMGDWHIPGIYNIHKLLGLSLLVLVIIRIVWTAVNGYPSHPPTVTKLERVLSRSVQGLLYICMLLMPLAGWAMSTAAGYFPHIGTWNLIMPGIPHSKALAAFFSDVHATTAVVLMVLIGLHILGAAKHALIDKDTVLHSMLPSGFLKKER